MKEHIIKYLLGEACVLLKNDDIIETYYTARLGGMIQR